MPNQRRRSLRSLAIVSAIVILSTSTIASAGRRGGGGSRGGRLGKVGAGMRSGASSSSGSGGSSSGGSRSSGASHGSRSSSAGHRYRSSGYHSSLHSHAPFGFGSLSLPKVAAAVYGGAQKLVESDKAFSFDGRILFNNKIGVTGRFTQFTEPAADPRMSTLRLDLWSVAATYRFQVTPALEVSPELGFAGAGFSGGGMGNVAEIGAVGGLSMRYRLAPSLALIGTGRFFSMTGAASAVEGRAGVAVGPLQLSYRSVYFMDAGPPLEGPEVGLAFGFFRRDPAAYQ